ncbi:TIGR01777 family oxidoreductase [Parvicella tangerina]|uniref:Epimerase family protein n=1 Tax=Parvicella tangerina TaxID=2829795 RepID=A0A916NRF8_9FLAO|nr:TIGR01777 family oxidoreductase [Parvicella tangerina]CAG5081099.1 Epimerase family protein [Parvicella tangerina]
MRKIIIAGGTGFIGKELEQHFQSKGDHVVILTRNPKKDNEIYWNGRDIGKWADVIEGSDILINMSGRSVDCRYTAANKKAIMNSRINSTAALQKVVKFCSNPPSIWLNSSTATIYADSHTHQNTEENGIIGNDFSMGVAKAWEAEFFKSPTPFTRKVAMRTSLVLGDSGGVYPVLKKLARFGLGGRAGNGKQKFAHIRIEELLRVVDFIIENETISGPVNCTSTADIDNETFMGSLRKEMGIRCYINQPEWMIRLGAIIIRTEPELILKSRYVYPEKLVRAGFKFNTLSYA